ncbi:MAG: basic amino acid ABC transporter substrate-binding protein [Candidatus Avilachnospira sp.]|jgi:ABC-type amino acid transport substrate-binding protein
MKKKFMAMIITAAMAASLAACGSADTAEETTAAQAESTAEETEAASEETASEESAEETEAETAGGTLTMATNAEFDPWEYHDGDDIIGIDPEVAQAIADKLGMELKIEDMAFDAVIPSVTSGKADIGMAAISVTPERQASVDFTDTYAESALMLIVAADNEEIAGVDDLSDHIVGVQTGTTGDLKASELVGDDNVDRFNTYFEAVESLKQGKVDAVLIDNAPAKVFLSQNSDSLKQAGEELDKEEYAIAVAKGNEELVESLNSAIAELKEDGKLDEIMNKYIPAE